MFDLLQLDDEDLIVVLLTLLLTESLLMMDLRFDWLHIASMIEEVPGLFVRIELL